MTQTKIIERIVYGASQPGTAILGPGALEDLGIATGDMARLTSLAGDKGIDVKVSLDPTIGRTSILVPRGFASTHSMVYINALIKAGEIKETNKNDVLTPSSNEPQKKPSDKNSQDQEPKSRMLMGRPNLRLSDVAGLERAKQEIEEKLILPFSHQETAKRFGIKSGGGVLLYGPPGTGKTHIARAVAGEVDGGFFYITPSEILDKWVGSSEGNVAELFQEARAQKRSVIFFDEVESLLPKRSDSSSDVMGRVVPQFLAEMDGIKGSNENILFLGATNKPWSLDPAVLRPGRFDEKIYIPLPDEDARVVLFQINLKSRPLDESVSFQHLADITDGYSGADIVEICNKASLKPFRESIDGGKFRPISEDDLKDAISRLEPSVNPDDLQYFDLPSGNKPE